jgi:hypothetical protein
MNFQLVQSYGRDREMAVNNRDDQEIDILSLRLLQICMVYIMQLENFRELTPLFYGHITPYGEFQLDMNKRINIEETI